MMRRLPNNRRTAFTLVEATVGMGVMAVLMAGMGSAVLLAGKALPSSDTRLAATTAAAEAVDEIAGELLYADWVWSATTTGIQFDVTRGGVSQTIYYSWSGVPGDPLMRKSDAGVFGTFIEHVHEFTLSYDVFVPGATAAVQQESAEAVLSSFEAVSAQADYAMTDKAWIAQHIKPALAADAVSWKVTRVLVKARIHGGDGGITAVQLRTPNASSLPSTSVLEEVLMPEVGLSDVYLWQEFAFSTVSGLTPSESLCLTLALNTKDAHLCDVQYDSAAGSGLSTTSNADAGWASAAGALSHFVYGTVTTEVPAQAGVPQLRSVGIRLRVGDDASARVDATARLLNEPEMP